MISDFLKSFGFLLVFWSENKEQGLVVCFMHPQWLFKSEFVSSALLRRVKLLEKLSTFKPIYSIFS